MIRLATVFSGIGAIEHALDRMGVEHKIVFACDNGDVDILSKKITPSIPEITKEMVELSSILDEIKAKTSMEADKEQLAEMESALVSLKARFLKSIKNTAIDTDNFESISNSVLSVINWILKSKKLNNSKLKAYEEISEKIRNYDSDDKSDERYYLLIDSLVKLVREYSYSYSLSDFDEGASQIAENDDWYSVRDDIKYLYGIQNKLNAKKQLKELRSIAELLGMQYEKLKSFSILKDLESIKDYKEKKAYVDNLYKPYESQNKVKKSYMANYDVSEDNFHWNVSFLDGYQYTGKVDLFVGGSPCQSFSLVGKQRGLEDTRGTLFYEYARLIKEIQPKVFIYENVKAVLSNDEGRTWATMSSIFTSLDYEWAYQILNARDYGVPQNRERVFVVGVRKDLANGRKYEFPKPIKLEKKMKDYLLDNVSARYYLPEKGIEFVTSQKNLDKRYTQIDGDVALCQKKNQQFNWHGDFVFVEETKDKEKLNVELKKYYLSDKVKKYVLATGTKNFYSKPQIDLDIARPLLTTMHKMHRAGVDNYVTSFGHLRKLTPRECLRLMGFCDSFKIVVSDTAAYQQAGNSIVVDVLMHVMENIFICFKGVFDD